MYLWLSVSYLYNKYFLWHSVKKILFYYCQKKSLTNGSEVIHTQQNSTSKSNQILNTSKNLGEDLQIKIKKSLFAKQFFVIIRSHNWDVIHKFTWIKREIKLFFHLSAVCFDKNNWDVYRVDHKHTEHKYMETFLSLLKWHLKFPHISLFFIHIIREY